MSPIQRHRQGLVALALVLAGSGSVWLLDARARRASIEAGLWFDAVTFEASEVEADRLGGGVSADEMRRIQAVARAEVERAFSGMRLVITGNRDAPYSVRVVQTIQHPVFRRTPVAGASRGVWPLGGSGAVNFRLLASHAIAYAPAGATRGDRIDAIGRGVGRAAVHEFSHQILGSFDIHAGRDAGSYEFWNADRPQQYYGDIRWDVAGPRLQQRLGLRASSSR